MGDERRVTDSGIELRALYEPRDLDGWDPDDRLGDPGAFPFTRGPYPSMYRGRLWTMRQYAGLGAAEDTNRRFRYLLEHGQTGLSVALRVRSAGPASRSTRSRTWSGSSPGSRSPRSRHR